MKILPLLLFVVLAVFSSSSNSVELQFLSDSKNNFYYCKIMIQNNEVQVLVGYQSPSWIFLQPGSLCFKDKCIDVAPVSCSSTCQQIDKVNDKKSENIRQKGLVTVKYENSGNKLKQQFLNVEKVNLTNEISSGKQSIKGYLKISQSFQLKFNFQTHSLRISDPSQSTQPFLNFQIPQAYQYLKYFSKKSPLIMNSNIEFSFNYTDKIFLFPEPIYVWLLKVVEEELGCSFFFQMEEMLCPNKKIFDKKQVFLCFHHTSSCLIIELKWLFELYKEKGKAYFRILYGKNNSNNLVIFSNLGKYYKLKVEEKLLKQITSDQNNSPPVFHFEETQAPKSPSIQKNPIHTNSQPYTFYGVLIAIVVVGYLLYMKQKEDSIKMNSEDDCKNLYDEENIKEEENVQEEQNN